MVRNAYAYEGGQCLCRQHRRGNGPGLCGGRLYRDNYHRSFLLWKYCGGQKPALGYEHAKAEGDKLGLQVFFGWESGYQGTEFLIYGPDKKWLLEHPQIRDATIPEQFELVHQGGGIVVHAHPFREASYISEIRLFPEYVDGVEGVNATHSSTRKTIPLHPEYNECAINYAREHGLPLTGGSDQHNTEMIMGGMVFARKLIDIRDFAGAVIAGEAVRIPDGTQEA